MRAGLRLAAAGAVIAAALAGCGQGGSAATAATTAAPLTPLQECTTVVTSLLEQTQEAVEQGYSDGISNQSVYTQYGLTSSVWLAFVSLKGAELAYFVENGVGGGAPPQVLRQVPQYCEFYAEVAG
jgi:hypothetical protein